MGFEDVFRAQHRLVYSAQGRAAIAGDEPRGVEAGGEVAFALQHGQAHQGLGAGEEDAAGIQRVLVVQRDFVQLGWGVHWGSPCRDAVAAVGGFFIGKGGGGKYPPFCFYMGHRNHELAQTKPRGEEESGSRSKSLLMRQLLLPQ